MKYTLTFDEEALAMVLAGLNELPAKHSRELINQIMAIRDQVDKDAVEQAFTGRKIKEALTE